MSWFLLVLNSAISFSLASLLQRILLKEEQSDPIAYGVVFQFLIAVLIFVFALFYGFSIPNLIPLIPNLIIMTLFYALFNLCLFKAYQQTEASEVSVLLASRSLWSVVTAIFFLGETVNLQRIGGIVLIIGGVILVSWKAKKWQINKGHLFTLLAAFFIGTAFTNDAFLINRFPNVPSYLVISFLLPSLTLLMLQPKAAKNLKLFLNPKRLGKMLLTSFLWGSAALTIFLSYQAGGKVTQISPISQLSIVLTVILAFIFLKERENWGQKLIGAAIVFGGVMLLI